MKLYQRHMQSKYNPFIGLISFIGFFNHIGFMALLYRGAFSVEMLLFSTLASVGAIYLTRQKDKIIENGIEIDRALSIMKNGTRQRDALCSEKPVVKLSDIDFSRTSTAYRFFMDSCCPNDITVGEWQAIYKPEMKVKPNPKLPASKPPPPPRRSQWQINNDKKT